MAGPLSGVRIIEMAGLGPGPFAGMMLADHGAEVIRIDRPGGMPETVLGRSRRSIVVDLKSPEGIAVMRKLVKTADGLIEGLRPGVMERLGLGPDVLLGDNPRLVYGRMTGWGQTGPLAHAAGHDINYIALSGALHAYGRAGEKPTPPINMVGDFGGGGMMLAFGMAAALLSVQKTGKGQVLDVAMLDTGTHFYDTYECKDGGHISIGSIEPQFYAALRRIAGLENDAEFDAQMDPSRWGPLKARLTALFLTKTRAEWCALMEGTDVCFAPVLSLTEAPSHPHNAARGTFIEVGGMTQPAPAPRYSETVTDRPTPTPRAGADTAVILGELGYSDAEIVALAGARAIAT